MILVAHRYVLRRGHPTLGGDWRSERDKRKNRNG
jgi:hypothetical protein